MMMVGKDKGAMQHCVLRVLVVHDLTPAKRQVWTKAGGFILVGLCLCSGAEGAGQWG